MNPLEAMATHFKTPDALAARPWPDFSTYGHVWLYRRSPQDLEQVVIRPYVPMTSPDATVLYDRYGIEISVYALSDVLAGDRMHAIWAAYNQYAGNMTDAPGMTFSAAWRTPFVQAQEVGVLDAIPVTNGELLRAVLTVVCTPLIQL